MYITKTGGDFVAKFLGFVRGSYCFMAFLATIKITVRDHCPICL